MNKKFFDWERHHQSFIEEWEEMHDNVDDNNEPHTNRCRMRVLWIEDDYTNIESSDDEDTAYDQSTRARRQVEAGPILDRVVSQLPYFSTLSCIPIH